MRWGVFRLYDSGRRELVTPAYSEQRASELAGCSRDRMSDGDVGRALAQGWNYHARPLTKAELSQDGQKKRLGSRKISQERALKGRSFGRGRDRTIDAGGRDPGK